MAIIGAEVAKAGTLVNAGEAAMPAAQGGTDIIQILKYISDIFNSPLANVLLSKMQAGQPIAPRTSLGSGVIPPPQLPGPPAGAPQITQANLMEFLKNPEGQKALIEGLETLQKSAGDLKISQIISMVQGEKKA